jgi:class 3 adenylate cyclase
MRHGPDCTAFSRDVIGLNRQTGTVPNTEYARRGNLHIAYQVVGASDPSLVLAADWFGNVELMWENTAVSYALDRLASIGRLIVFDKLGVGLSDPLPISGLPTIEEWIEDVTVVMDDANVERAALIGTGAGGPMAMQFTATHPSRVSALVLVNTYSRLSRAPDYPAGVPERIRDLVLDVSYTDDITVEVLAGTSPDEAFRTWWHRYQRHSVSPAVAAAMRRMMFDVDVRSVLGAIHVPTLVLHRRDDPWVRIGHAHYLAQAIPGATLVELPGNEDLYFLGDVDSLLDRIEEFLTGAPPAARAERVLASMLFTDVVRSTETMSRVGDRRWHQLLDRHDVIFADAIEQFRGRKVNSAGDSMLVVFDGPGRAIGCATRLRDELAALDLSIRAGVHTGEVEVRGDDLTGVAVNVAARIMAMGDAGDILVSSTVRDLVSGSGLTFADLGRRTLKGLPDPWQVYRLS